MAQPPKIITKNSGTITCSSGGAGTGTVTGITGKILGVYVNLGTDMTTAAVTIANDVGDTILNAVTVTADTYYPVNDAPVANDGSTAYTNSFVPYINAGGSMAITVASATASKTLVVTVYADNY